MTVRKPTIGVTLPISTRVAAVEGLLDYVEWSARESGGWSRDGDDYDPSTCDTCLLDTFTCRWMRARRETKGAQGRSTPKMK